MSNTTDIATNIAKLKTLITDINSVVEAIEYEGFIKQKDTNGEDINGEYKNEKSVCTISFAITGYLRLIIPNKTTALFSFDLSNTTDIATNIAKLKTLINSQTTNSLILSKSLTSDAAQEKSEESEEESEEELMFENSTVKQFKNWLEDLNQDFKKQNNKKFYKNEQLALTVKFATENVEHCYKIELVEICDAKVSKGAFSNPSDEEIIKNFIIQKKKQIEWLSSKDFIQDKDNASLFINNQLLLIIYFNSNGNIGLKTISKNADNNNFISSINTVNFKNQDSTLNLQFTEQFKEKIENFITQRKEQIDYLLSKDFVVNTQGNFYSNPYLQLKVLFSNSSIELQFLEYNSTIKNIKFKDNNKTENTKLADEFKDNIKNFIDQIAVNVKFLKDQKFIPKDEKDKSLYTNDELALKVKLNKSCFYLNSINDTYLNSSQQKSVHKQNDFQEKIGKLIIQRDKIVKFLNDQKFIQDTKEKSLYKNEELALLVLLNNGTEGIDKIYIKNLDKGPNLNEIDETNDVELGTIITKRKEDIKDLKDNKFTQDVTHKDVFIDKNKQYTISFDNENKILVMATFQESKKPVFLFRKDKKEINNLTQLEEEINKNRDEITKARTLLKSMSDSMESNRGEREIYTIQIGNYCLRCVFDTLSQGMTVYPSINIKNFFVIARRLNSHDNLSLKLEETINAFIDYYPSVKHESDFSLKEQNQKFDKIFTDNDNLSIEARENNIKTKRGEVKENIIKLLTDNNYTTSDNTTYNLTKYNFDNKPRSLTVTLNENEIKILLSIKDDPTAHYYNNHSLQIIKTYIDYINKPKKEKEKNINEKDAPDLLKREQAEQLESQTKPIEEKERLNAETQIKDNYKKQVIDFLNLKKANKDTTSDKYNFSTNNDKFEFIVNKDKVIYTKFNSVNGGWTSVESIHFDYNENEFNTLKSTIEDVSNKLLPIRKTEIMTYLKSEGAINLKETNDKITFDGIYAQCEINFSEDSIEVIMSYKEPFTQVSHSTKEVQLNNNYDTKYNSIIKTLKKGNELNKEAQKSKDDIEKFLSTQLQIKQCAKENNKYIFDLAFFTVEFTVSDKFVEKRSTFKSNLVDIKPVVGKIDYMDGALDDIERTLSIDNKNEGKKEESTSQEDPLIDDNIQEEVNNLLTKKDGYISEESESGEELEIEDDKDLTNRPRYKKVIVDHLIKGKLTKSGDKYISDNIEFQILEEGLVVKKYATNQKNGNLTPDSEDRTFNYTQSGLDNLRSAYSIFRNIEGIPFENKPIIKKPIIKKPIINNPIISNIKTDPDSLNNVENHSQINPRKTKDNLNENPLGAGEINNQNITVQEKIDDKTNGSINTGTETDIGTNPNPNFVKRHKLKVKIPVLLMSIAAIVAGAIALFASHLLLPIAAPIAGAALLVSAVSAFCLHKAESLKGKEKTDAKPLLIK